MIQTTPSKNLEQFERCVDDPFQADEEVEQQCGDDLARRDSIRRRLAKLFRATERGSWIYDGQQEAMARIIEFGRLPEDDGLGLGNGWVKFYLSALSHVPRKSPPDLSTSY